MPSYADDVKEVLETLLDLRKNLGRRIEVEVYCRGDKKRVVGTLSSREGESDLYLKWPSVHIMVRDAIIYHKGKEEVREVKREPLNPLTGNFNYKFVEEENSN